MKLAYVAFDRSGRQVTDTLDADSVAAGSETLRRQGLFVTALSAGSVAVGPVRRHAASGRPGTSRLRDLALFMRQLHALVACGTPVVPALASLERQARRGRWQDCLARIRVLVEEGLPLSAAMQGYPEYFDPVCRSLVAAGESTGNLPAMLDRIAATTRKQLHIRNTIIGALVYPALLLGVALVALTILLVVVIPKFRDLFGNLDVPLPPTTELLLGVSQLVIGWWWAVLVALGALAAGVKVWLSSEAGHRWVEAAVLRLPQVGTMVRSFATARIARLLGILLESRVSILEALRLTRQSIGGRYAALVARTEEAVAHGQPMSEAFSQSDLISPSVCEAIRSGEQSGQVGALLLNIADFLDEENEIVIRSLASIIEPVILILMGVLVAVVAISMFMPLFDLTAIAQRGAP